MCSWHVCVQTYVLCLRHVLDVHIRTNIQRYVSVACVCTEVCAVFAARIGCTYKAQHPEVCVCGMCMYRGMCLEVCVVFVARIGCTYKAKQYTHVQMFMCTHVCIHTCHRHIPLHAWLESNAPS